MRKSNLFFLTLGILAAMVTAAWAHAAYQREHGQAALRERADMVKQLDLTDLCLFTEARYTRHPTQADRHAPFQDHPMSLEHFPSGSLLALPKGIGGR